MTVLTETGRKQINIKKAVFWNRVLLEKGQQLFLLGYDTEDRSDTIIRLDMKDFSWKTLHQVPDRYLASDSFYSFSYDGASFIYLQRSRAEAERPGLDSDPLIRTEDLELVSLDPASGKRRTIAYRSPLFKKYYEPRFFGCDQINGLRFWLVAHKWSNVLRLWEDGRVEDLGLSKGFPAYYGHLLFTIGDNSLQVRKLLENGSEIIKEITGNFKLVQSIYPQQVSNGLNEVYAIRNKRIVHIDLANLAVDDVGSERGLIYLVPPGDFYFVEFENWPGQGTDRWKKLYRLQGGKMVLLKQFDFNDAGYGHVFVDIFGVILRQIKIVSKISKISTSVFVFPDLKELQFKKLH